MASCLILDRRYWADPDFEGVGGNAKLLYIYLSGSQHTNILGVSKVTITRVSEEIELSKDQVLKAIDKLCSIRKIEADVSSNLYWVRAALRRERNLTQDIFFKGVMKEVIKLPDHPITKNLISEYEDVFRRQAAGKRYSEKDQSILLAFVDKFLGATKPQPSTNQAAWLVHKDKDKDKDILDPDLNLFSNKGAIAIAVPNGNASTGGRETLKSKFDAARKSYPGTKGGLETEWKNFEKKYAKEAEAIIQLLAPAIVAEKEHKARLKDARQFVPSWKNFQTWINNRCWEQEFGEIGASNGQPGKYGTNRRESRAERLDRDATDFLRELRGPQGGNPPPDQQDVFECESGTPGA